MHSIAYSMLRMSPSMDSLFIDDSGAEVHAD